MSASTKSKSSRRSFVKAAVAAPLAAVAGLQSAQADELREKISEVKPKARDRKAKAKKRDVQKEHRVSPPARTVVYLATIDTDQGRRVALATLEQAEADRFAESFNRMNANSSAFAEVHQRLFDLSLSPVPIFFAVHEKANGEREIVSASLNDGGPSAYAETWNSICPGDPRFGKAHVVMGTAFLDEVEAPASVKGGQV